MAQKDIHSEIKSGEALGSLRIYQTHFLFQNMCVWASSHLPKSCSRMTSRSRGEWRDG